MLAALPFHALGQASCVDDPRFSISPVNSNLRATVGCSWITAQPTATTRRVDRVCGITDVLNSCVASCTGCTPPVPPTIFSVVFTMTNAADGNAIVMYERNEETGFLSYPLTFPTGGNGGDSALQAPPDDPLASQNSLTVADNCLLAVNAGSNTLTSFQIYDGTSINLELVSIVGSGGDIPVSITAAVVSPGLHIVYTVNAGGMGSISGYTLNEECMLEPIADSIRSLNQATRDPSLIPLFITVPAQVSFTPDSTQLYVTIKGIDQVVQGGGSIYQWNVDAISGIVSNLRILATIDIAPFSFDFDVHGRLLVANGFGESDFESPNAGSVSVYDIEDGDLTRISTVSTQQTATCWVKSDGACTYTTNNGSGSISSLATSLLGDITLISAGANGNSELNQPIDLVRSPDLRYLYVLGTNHANLPDPSRFTLGQPEINVYEVSSTTSCALELIQTFGDGIPNEFTSGFGAVGMALFTVPIRGII